MRRRAWVRLPLLASGLLLVLLAVGVRITDPTKLDPIEGLVLLVLGSALLGAFIYSEGVHHNDRHDGEDDR